VTLSVQIWETPTSRVTWDAAHELVRADNMAHSRAILTDQVIDDAIRRAVDLAWPRCYEQHLWQGELDAYTPLLALPMPVEDVVLCAWTRTSTGVLEAPAMTTGIHSKLWTIDGGDWRFLGSKGQWLDGTLSFALRAIVKPRPKGTAFGEEPTYCTLEPKYLLPLAKLELVPQIVTDQGGSFVDAYNAQEAMRRMVIERLPRMVRPQSAKQDSIASISTIIWHSWGQENITFENLG
jgi:hypothetical protein